MNNLSLVLNKNKLFLLVLPPILVSFIFLFLKVAEFKSLHIILILSPLPLFFLFNFRYSLVLLLLLIFINFNILLWHISAIFGCFVLISYFLSFSQKDFGDLKNPLTFPIIIYLSSIIPSFFNNSVIQSSLLFLSTLILSFMLLHVIYASMDYNLIKTFIISFLSFSFLNGISVVIEGLILGKRAFGITGIMFVDYVSISIVITFILLIISKKKLFYFLTLLFFFFCSLLHQTRGIWIVVLVTMLFVLLYFIFNSAEYKISKRFLLGILFLFFIIIGTSFLIEDNLNLGIKKRSVNIENMASSLDKEGNTNNSVLTRSMIWATAYNAFKEHPILGIGSHSFKFQSKKFSSIHPFLYKKYVKDLTPHGTYFAILPETGIIGLLGFLFLTFFSLKQSYLNIKMSISPTDKKHSVILFFILVYINFSMVITDAWLWGSNAILWGIVLGLNVLHNKKLLQHRTVI